MDSGSWSVSYALKRSTISITNLTYGKNCYSQVSHIRISTLEKALRDWFTSELVGVHTTLRPYSCFPWMPMRIASYIQLKKTVPCTSVQQVLYSLQWSLVRKSRGLLCVFFICLEISGITSKFTYNFALFKLKRLIISVLIKFSEKIPWIIICIFLFLWIFGYNLKIYSKSRNA